MLCNQPLTSFGLVLDIIAVTILFFYGLPSPVKTKKYMEEKEPDENTPEGQFNKKVRKLARLGLFILLVGFIFQLIGSLCA
jgi:hypothetical protein